jgi:hypothetical protein
MASIEDSEATLRGDDANSVPAPLKARRPTAVKIFMAVAAGLVLIAAIACLVALELGYPRLQGVVAPSLIKSSSEQAYTAPLPQPAAWAGVFSLASDGVEDPHASRLKLFEDGFEVGPPHTAHVDIAKGGGGYSHWGNTLYFSSTRGDNPQTSGREYRVLAVYTPAAWLAPALMVLAVLAGAALLAATLGRSTFTLLRRFAPPVVYAATAAGIVLAVVVAVADLRQVQDLAPTAMHHSGGYSYAAEFSPSAHAIPFLEPVRANRNSASGPNVRLLEDDERIGMPRARAELIQTLGAGRYSVTGTSILFSTPDNSDPRTNGRSYAVQERLVLSGAINVAIIVLLGISLLLLARRHAVWVLGGLGAAAAAAGIVGVLSYFNLITHDEYVSPANLYLVVGDTNGFSINGSLGPFVSVAPVGAPTAVGIGDDLIQCELKPILLSSLERDGRGVCAPRDSSVDVDIIFPDNAGEGAAPDFYRYPVRVHLYAIVALFAASAMLLLAVWFRPSARQTVFGAGALVGGLGAVLMAANISGMFLSLRPEIPGEPVEGIRLVPAEAAYENALGQLEWKEGDSAATYAPRANQMIFEATFHGDPPTDLGRWRLEIPVWENWSLNALGAVNPLLKKYRYWNHEKEFERGIGLCGNLSAILVGYLGEHDIPGRIVGLDGHVVVTAEVRPGVWHILDPDYGVAIPHSLEELQRNPALVEAAYSGAVDSHILGMIVGYYTTSHNNSIDQSGRDGFYSGWDGSAEIYRSREQFMELLKWVGPSMMMAAGLALGLAAFFWRGRRRKAEGSVETGASVPGATEVGRA